MENLKIRIPCEEVSILVQEKAFEKGYGWCYGKDTYKEGKFYIFLKDFGTITYIDAEDEEYFSDHSNKEISWQEWVFGEGFFFVCEGYDEVYFQAKKNNVVYFVYSGEFKEAPYSEWKEGEEYWIETDMFGNKLEEKPMKEEVKLYDDKINLELTAYQVAVIKDLFGGLVGSEDGVFFKMMEVLPVVGHINFDIDMDVKDNEGFKECVELILSKNGYVKEAPKPIKEMSLADVQVLLKDIGYDVKIIME